MDGPAHGDHARTRDPSSIRRVPREADILAALGNPLSRCLLELCSEQARSVRELAHECRMPITSTYRHVHALLDTGVLFVQRAAITAGGKRLELYRSSIREVQLRFESGRTHVAFKLNEDAVDRLQRAWLCIRGA